MSPRRTLSAILAAAVAVTSLSLVAASPASASTVPYGNLLISEVYGGDGSANASYHHDFVELFNPTSSAISFASGALYISYSPLASTATPTPVALPAATIPAYTHFMVERSSNGSGATPVNQNVPHADATVALPDIAGSGGRVYLQDTADGQAVAGDVTGNAHIIDAVSASGASSFEGSVGKVSGNATTSLQRKDDATHGYQDTNDTASDLIAAGPTPQSVADGALTVSGSPLAIASVGAKTGNVGTPVNSFILSASGGTAPYSYALSGSSGTDGLVVDPGTGTVSGTPADAGTFAVTATVTDSADSPATVSDDFTFTVSAASTDTADHVVISEVWGDGGFTGSAWRNSFIELYNPTDADVDLSGYTIGYGAYDRAAGDALSSAGLDGTIPSHGRYLISAESLGSAGADLPTPDATTTLNPDYLDGLVVLWTGTVAPTPAIGDITGEEATDHIVDAVGYGTGDTFEGAKMASNASQTQSAYRSPAGTDTNDGAVDFTLGTPSPTNSKGETFPQLKLGAILDQSVLVDAPATLPTLAATGGQDSTYTYALTGAPHGIGVDATTGVLSGQPDTVGIYTVTATATDSHGDTVSQTFTITVGTFIVSNPGDQTFDTITPVDLTLHALPADGSYSFAVTDGALPAGVALDSATGALTGTPTAQQAASSITITVTNAADGSTIAVTFNITVTADVVSIATVQGDGARSPYAPDSGTASGTTAITTEGIVTAVWKRGYTGTGTAAALGTANSGLSGFVIQSAGDPADTAGSDAIFVYTYGFTGKDKNGDTIAVGQSVKVSGKVSEYESKSAKSSESETELNATVADTAILSASLGKVTVQTALPATYADREAHEFESFAPTDAVISDTYQYETDGELGVASGGTPLVQPTEICADDDTACLAAANQDIIDRGYFLGDGTNVFFTSGSTHYAPNKSGNSAIPLPYMDATHSVRVGANIEVPSGHALILAFSPDLSSTSASRAGKWYLQPERAVLGEPGSATTQGTPDLGADVVGFADTRTDNESPDESNIDKTGASNLKIATFNVENYFTETGEAFASANPAIGNSADGTTSSTKVGCQYDTDRAGKRELVYQCVSPWAQATAWDAVSGAATAYKAGLTNAPRGAATAADLDRQTAKIVTAINGLGADIVSLEEIENPNKLKEGVTNSPLSPDLDNLKDQGQGTAIANRDAALGYLVDKLNAAAGEDVWAYVKSPEEATDATSMAHLCSVLRGDGTTPIDGNAASIANSSCSYASMQDVIRSAFIYKKAKIVPVGSSDIDFPANPLSPDNAGNEAERSYNGASPFDVAREPLAQYFKPVGYPNSDGFAVIVNHFKSKGGTSTDDDPGITITGDNVSDPLVGAYNAARTAEAKELVRFANQFAQKWNTDKVLMVGDFNSYTKEDPVQEVLNDSNVDGGLHFGLLSSSDPDDITYNYTSNVSVGGDTVGYGTVGSIDHEFASAGFLSMVTGADVWEINANETDAYDYGRYNTNATNFYYGTNVPSSPSYADDLAAATPFRSSDHNPMIMGIKLPALDDSSAAKVTDVQIVGVNDFHGRLVADSSDGGAAALGGAVSELKDQYGADKTIFASGGDNVGASTFESFTQQDKPSLDALTAMNLQVSTVGNHEFDKGWKDIIERLDKPYDAKTNPYGADGGTSWGDYLAANVVYTTDTSDPDYDADKAGKPITAATKEFTISNPLNADKPIKVGFIGTVTPDLASLESPANLAGVHIDTEAETIAAINTYASQLKANGDQLVILLTHEGAASVDCSTMTGSGSSFAQELNGLSDSVDAVLSGHTHLEYSCSFPVAGWSGRAITSRPVMQSGSYAVALDQLVYSFDANSEPVNVTSNLVGVKGPVSALFSAPDDPTVKTIVDNAVTASEEPGAKVLGKLGGHFDRARLSDGTENRGGESTLGNTIAEIQRWATKSQIAFMNPGGLRADLDGTGGELTYRQAADVQPFANELTTMTLTGAQIKRVLEEQWSRDNIDNAKANIPARPFLKLGTSDGFTYTYHEVTDAVHAGATLGVIDGMWLNGAPISLTDSYTVTVNSFLAAGGDNFWELANGADQRDTEQTDLQAQVDYMQQYQDTALPVDYSQHAVRVTFPADASASYSAGDHVVFDLSSLDMTGPDDVTDDSVTVTIGDKELGSATVTHANSTQPYDDRGTAHVDVVLPGGLTGTQTLTVTGATTHTTVLVPVTLTSTTMVAGTPTISGTAQVGKTLTAHPGTWTPSDADLAYVWMANGVAVSGATGTTLALDADQLGKAITVTVTGTATGFDSASASSSPTAKVAAGALSKTPKPKISDTTPKVGQKLTVKIGSWDSGVKTSVQWLVGGVRVHGATSSSYTVKAADVKKTVRVTVTGSKAGYATVSKTSEWTTKVAAGALSKTPKPKISDTTPKVGQKLTVKIGSWDSGVKKKIQWFVNGKKVAHATHSTFKVRKADHGKKITVSVTGTKTGYSTVKETSKKTAKVR